MKLVMALFVIFFLVTAFPNKENRALEPKAVIAYLTLSVMGITLGFLYHAGYYPFLSSYLYELMEDWYQMLGGT